MITLKTLDRALKAIRDSENKGLFSPRKSMVAYRLSRMSSQYRGRVVERMIRDYFISKKKTVWYYGGSHPFDMRVNGKRIEVKSALARKENKKSKDYSYNFQHIKPHNFDKLIMVFVSPEGIQTRVVDSRTVAKHLGCCKKHKSVYVGKRNPKRIGKTMVA
jgi:hypothetical protein